MKRLYEKILDSCLNFCSKKNSKVYIYLISFIESIFFPIPTDIFLFPYVLVRQKEYLRISIYVTFFCSRRYSCLFNRFLHLEPNFPVFNEF